MAALRNGLAALLISALITGCAGSTQVRHDQGPAMARERGWSWQFLRAGVFDLATAQSQPRGAVKSLSIYLEGDGMAYATATKPAMDPTPSDPVALRMALADPSGAVAWIGRPCQYSLTAEGGDHGRGCDPSYWTNARYAPIVVASLNQAIDQLKARYGAQQIVLYGYSGGGALAVLVGAGRSDVDHIVTAAANLDLAAWTESHGLTPLSGSLDPARDGGGAARIPQVHFTGALDDKVGTSVARSYVRRLPPQAPVQVIEIAGFSHACCWAVQWPELLQKVH